MLQFTARGRFGRNLLIAGVVLGASVMAAPAFAGECPADQKKADARAPVDVAAVGKTDTVIATLDVAKEHGIDGRIFRMRRLTIEPGGIVPWHSHDDRPGSSTSSAARSRNIQATALSLSCTRPATSAPRPRTFRIGGRTPATKP